MSEKGMRSRIVKGLRPLDAVAVENPAYPGTPDVNCIYGWLELKWMRDWPKIKADQLVLCRHFTPQQRIWLARRHRKGGVACLLLQVGKQWLLFEGDVAAARFGRATKAELLDIAAMRWPNGLRDKELIECLKSLHLSQNGRSSSDAETEEPSSRMPA